MTDEYLFESQNHAIAEQERRTLAEHVEEYEVNLLAKGDGPRHVRDTMRRLRVMVRLCRAQFWRQINPHMIRASVLKLRADRPRRKTIGLATVNHYLVSLKSFCAWMIEEDRAFGKSPCRKVRKFNADLDVRHARRALTEAEFHRLLRATMSAKTIGKVAGRERALVYYIAAITGLRAAEIDSLKLVSFDVDVHPRLIVEAKNTKGKCRAEIQLEPVGAELVKLHIEQAQGRDEIFLRPSNAVRALRQDLAVAGIPYVVRGEHVDFHALRHTFVTAVQKKTHLKGCQTLARHKDPRTTMKHYAHFTEEDQRQTVRQLPFVEAGRELLAAFKRPLDERTPNHAITLTDRAGPARL